MNDATKAYAYDQVMNNCWNQSPGRVWFCEGDADHEGDHGTFQTGLSDDNWTDEEGVEPTLKWLRDGGYI